MSSREQVQAPSQADQAAMGIAGGTAVAQAAADGATKEQATEAAATAVRQTAEQRGFEFSQKDAEMFARELIKQLDAVGAFDAPPEPVSAPATETVAVEQVTAAPGPAGADSQPRPHRSFAEKFRSHR